jgi:REP element-mobilizing transposase RayT
MSLERKFRYRRRLPHIQANVLKVDFVTDKRWELPEPARDIVLECCLYENHKTVELIAAVVMPDHVHLLIKPLSNSDGWPYSLPEIVGRIKSVSSHSIKKLLDRKLPVWQEESFDHALRASEPIGSAIEYIQLNPVEAGLVSQPNEYRWLFVANDR